MSLIFAADQGASAPAHAPASTRGADGGSNSTKPAAGKAKRRRDGNTGKANAPVRKAKEHRPRAERPAVAQSAPKQATSAPTDRQPASESAPASTTTFAELGVPASIAGVLAKEGKSTAFPIQVATLPDTLAGRDVLGRGRTGSGKTLAFAIPMVARLGAANRPTNTPRRPHGLVLAPTRELASQIAGVIEPLAQATGLRVTTIFGGVKQTRQERELTRGAEIVVACPGRLEDLMGQGVLTLADVDVTVIDEADLMADMGFLPGVTRILNATPKQGQRMLFSATLDNGVDKLVKRFLHDPVQHAVDSAESPVSTMTHHVFEVANEDEKKRLVEALSEGRDRSILFFRTKHRAKRTARQLTNAGIPTVDLQGNLSQNARDRNLALFESGEVRTLAATDVAARGVDVPDVGLVIHADPPTEHKAYLHRSGRTARAGHSGDVITIALPAERRELQQTLRKANIRVKPILVTASSPEVAELVGKPARRVEPTLAPNVIATASAQAPQGRSGRGKGRGGRKKPAVARAQESRESRGGRGQSRSARGGSARNGGQSRGTAAQSSGRAHSAANFSSRRRGR